MPMTINRFNLQLFNDENFVEEVASEEVTEEVVDTPVDETEETETEEVEEEPDYTEANKAFLERFKVQFDGKDKQYESIEQLIEDAQMGGALPRYKEKLSKFESNPLYKFMDNYMKEEGYDDPQKFVNDMNINTKMQDYMKKGMSEEDARTAAEEYVGRGQGSVDIKGKQIESFVNWHQKGVESGLFSEGLDAGSIPQAVLDAYDNGKPLEQAYLEHALKETALKTEQATLKKIMKNKETSSGELNTSPTNTTKNMTPKQIDKILGNMTSKEQSNWIDKNYDLIEKSGYFKQ